MGMVLSGELIARCDRCGRKVEIDIESLEEDSFAYERNMGDEIEYNFSGEHICEECGNQLSFCIKAFEYPVGALNYSDSECHGCELIESPMPEIEYDDADIDPWEENMERPMLDTILERCDTRYKGRSCAQCSDCSYGEHCPHSCDLIHQIAEKTWTPNLIVFQYVFSDMRKHSELDKIQKFIDVFSEFFNGKVENKS